MKPSLLIGCLWVLGIAAPAWAGPMDWGQLLVDHQPRNSGGLASDTLFTESQGGPELWQLVADDFRLSSSSSVHGIVYWGLYANDILPPTGETMRVRIYDVRPSDGLPGGMLYEQLLADPPRNWTGRTVITSEGGKEYEFEVPLAGSFTAQANPTYWLEVAQVGEVSSRFRWEFGAGSPQNGQAVSNANFPNWMSTAPTLNLNTAFQLYSLPEPSVLSLLASVWGFMLFSRKWRHFRV